MSAPRAKVHAPFSLTRAQLTLIIDAIDPAKSAAHSVAWELLLDIEATSADVVIIALIAGDS